MRPSATGGAGSGHAPEVLTQYIENRTFDELEVGDHVAITRTLRPQDIELFAVMLRARQAEREREFVS